MTLWTINDEATIVFMKSFYKHLTKGKSASEALNPAMKYMRKCNAFSEIKYWAAFVLLGDNVPFEFEAHELIS